MERAAQRLFHDTARHPVFVGDVRHTRLGVGFNLGQPEDICPVMTIAWTTTR